MINIYTIFLGDNPYDWKTLYEEFRDMLTPERRNRIDRCSSSAKKITLILSEMLMIYTARLAGAGPSARPARDERGKPFIPGLDRCFSITHSGDYIGCAISERKIGIDIEHKKDRNITAAGRFLQPEDCDYIAAGEDRMSRFYMIWTKYEAFLKCIGDGWANKKAVVFDDDSRSTIRYNGFEYEFTTVETKSGEYILSICAEKDRHTDSSITNIEICRESPSSTGDLWMAGDKFTESDARHLQTPTSVKIIEISTHDIMKM